MKVATLESRRCWPASSFALPFSNRAPRSPRPQPSRLGCFPSPLPVGLLLSFSCHFGEKFRRIVVTPEYKGSERPLRTKSERRIDSSPNSPAWLGCAPSLQESKSISELMRQTE